MAVIALPPILNDFAPSASAASGEMSECEAAESKTKSKDDAGNRERYIERGRWKKGKTHLERTLETKKDAFGEDAGNRREIGGKHIERGRWK